MHSVPFFPPNFYMRAECSSNPVYFGGIQHIILNVLDFFFYLQVTF